MKHSWLEVVEAFKQYGQLAEPLSKLKLKAILTCAVTERSEEILPAVRYELAYRIGEGKDL
jgi:hypothetical protein